MCKFCNTLKEKSLVSYDNHKSMKISYGQYQGVNVYGTVYMKGNMLSIGCGGSYRSESDCYYEDEGLDCDNENAHTSNNSYIHIQYCPFCGKKLDDHTYEIQKTNDDIKKLNNDLKHLEQDLRDHNIIVTYNWGCNKRILHNVEVWPGEYGDREEIDYIKYDNDNPLTIKQIKDKYPKVYFDIRYGRTRNWWDKGIYADLKPLTLYTKINCRCSGYSEFHSYDYKLNDDIYFKLVELGYIEHNEKKYNDLKKKQEKINKDIINIKKEIKKLEQYLKTL